ncbi:bifunctional peptidase and (3S)-lysyl hydroxylase Jmjd7-like isoform X2 [Periplaneta americana]|uniref:bifunctional peptidase and (3S)-lysyl hydroxylase Jmjd7-like isoform X2 n=1 Tax=Periplaneta americana TaxID=6978 RepID=UPI0037E8953C
MLILQKSYTEKAAGMAVVGSVLKSFKRLSTDAKDLYLTQDVPTLDAPLSPLEFYRNWVAPNLPVLMKGAVKHWPAIGKWSTQYFRNTLGEKLVTVAVTPNGYADAIATRTVLGPENEEHLEDYFVTPEERIMPLTEFFNALENCDDYPGVFYIQRQNSNLTEDYPELIDDVERDIPWATEAFGSEPEAANIWIGDKRAVTSMHKDPFENIYCVVSGYKDFTLHPPTDRPWIPYKKYPLARYLETSPGIFEIIPICNYKHNNNSNKEEAIDQHSHSSIALLEGCSERINTKNDSLYDPSDNKSKRQSKLVKRNHDINCNNYRQFLSYLNKLKMDDNLKIQANDIYDAYIKNYNARRLSGEEEFCICSKYFEGHNPVNSDEDDVDSVSELSSSCYSENIVPWICIDPLSPDLISYPLYKNATPVRVRVEAGDALYLPSLWFHHVQQSHACIAVNYWYDMRYDLKYAYFQFLESLLQK